MIRTCSIATTAKKPSSRRRHPSAGSSGQKKIPPLRENNTTKHFGLRGALAGLKVSPAFRGGRLPVFSRLLLLITSNRGELVTCQIAQSHANTPLASLIIRSSSSPSQCSQNPDQRASLPAIDRRVVMMAERLPAPASDLGAGAGLRKAWIAIDFYLIQSFHLGSNLLFPPHCEPIRRRNLLISPHLSLPPSPPTPPSEESSAVTCLSG